MGKPATVAVVVFQEDPLAGHGIHVGAGIHHSVSDSSLQCVMVAVNVSHQIYG
jgi:hypothetical protein